MKMVTVLLYLGTEFLTVATGQLQSNCMIFLIPNLRVSFIKWPRTASTIPAALFTLTCTYSSPKLIMQHDTAAQTHRDLQQLLHMITHSCTDTPRPTATVTYDHIYNGVQMNSELPV